MNIKNYLEKNKIRINSELEKILPPIDKEPRDLHYAIRYSVMADGKRIRPILAITAYKWCEGKSNKIYPISCALELIHAFSLIHDDLPSIDNDDLRRGKDSCHIKMGKILKSKKLGEATAIMAGDALQSLAFKIIAKSGDIRLINELADSTLNLVKGEMADILSEKRNITREELEFIHTNKTGALITSALRIGAITADAKNSELKSLTEYGKRIGLAFQIWDDVLDIVGNTDDLGKPQGSDEKYNKKTYPKLFGLEKSVEIAKRLVRDAKGNLLKNKDNEILYKIADLFIERKN